jgi:hypothetical protein
MSWLTSPPVLLAGLAASIIAIGQFLRSLARGIVLFPRLAVRLYVGSVVMSMFTPPGDRKPPPDLSRYTA